MADYVNDVLTVDDMTDEMSLDDTYDYILQRMLDNVPDEDGDQQLIDKREGSIIYNALAPVAVELTVLYDTIKNMLNDAFADTCSLDAMIKKARERGLTYREATQAEIEISVTPASLDMTGCRFLISDTDLAFTVTERVVPDDNTSGLWYAQCETAGTEGNVSSGDLILDAVGTDDTVADNLESASIVSIEQYAYDDETLDSLRARYFDSIKSSRFGGNVADYKAFMLSMDNVGASKVIPHWDGGGTVKVVFIDRDYNKPTDDEVKAAQTAIDPVENSGEGVGMAPIGHRVTVEAAEEVTIAVSATFTYMHGYKFSDAESSLKTLLENYLKTLRENWESGNVTVRTSAIENAFLNGTGIADVTGVAINGTKANLQLEYNQIPIAGGVSENAAS
jgi:uncharacterized phage protein gp47/JayE